MQETVKDLFAGGECSACCIHGNADVTIEKLAYDSRKVGPGAAFFCIPGEKVDGHTFAETAIRQGAVCVVTDHYCGFDQNFAVTEVVVPDARFAMAQAASRFYGNPSAQFKLFGVTGTNGKTTVTYLVDHINTYNGGTTGVIGTVGNVVAGKVLPTEHTTPESVDLQALFAAMGDAGCTAACMEVSSHALALQRVAGTTFAVTAFTNLTQDHLDYHKTMEAYFQAKALLFGEQYPAVRVVCIDDEWGRRLADSCKGAGQVVITTGFSEDADIHPISVDYAQTSTHVTLSLRLPLDGGVAGLANVATDAGVANEAREACEANAIHAADAAGSASAAANAAGLANAANIANAAGAQPIIRQLRYPLVGKFNVSNVMTALGAGLALGYSLHAVLSALEGVQQVPGRLQRVQAPDACSYSVYVDYAHTPDALEKAVGTLKAMAKGRVIVVFGCGGDRDKTKRPLMLREARAADVVVVTSDNPRTEDPLAIIADIMEGSQPCDTLVVEPDRARAIAWALEHAASNDCVLIAGKGHEDYQIIGTTKHHFSDVEVAEAYIKERF